MTNEFTMYVFVNNDLEMGKGKIAAQVGHVVGEITEKIVRSGYETSPTPDTYLRYMKWKNSGHKKIVLKATEKDLLALLEWPESVGIRDAGRTQVAPNSLTVVGFYPSDTLGSKVSSFKCL